MPVVDIYVFANNRGGIGKSFLMFQLVSQYADSNRDKKVLVVDLSVQGDGGALFLGGVQEPTAVCPARTRGMQNIVAARSKMKSAAAMISHIAPASGGADALARRMEALGVDAFDPTKFALNVAAVHPHETTPVDEASPQPDNLWVAPGGENLLEAVTESNWAAVGASLKKALESTVDDWVVFYDTDAELNERAPSKVGLCAATKIIVPMYDWGDFNRIFEDPVNSMFVTLEKVAAKGHVARVAKVVMNRLAKTTNKEVDFFENIPKGTPVAKMSFTIAKDVLSQIGEMCNALRHIALVENASIGANFLLDPPANINDKVAFSKQYFDAVMDMSGVQGNASSLSGVPVCRLRKKIVLDLSADSLAAMQHVVKSVSNNIFS